MRMLIGVVIVQQMLHWYRSFVIGIQFTKSFIDQIGNFLGNGVFDIIQKIKVVDSLLTLTSVEILDISNFLDGKKGTHFVHE